VLAIAMYGSRQSLTPALAEPERASDQNTVLVNAARGVATLAYFYSREEQREIYGTTTDATKQGNLTAEQWRKWRETPFTLSKVRFAFSEQGRKYRIEHLQVYPHRGAAQGGLDMDWACDGDQYYEYDRSIPQGLISAPRPDAGYQRELGLMDWDGKRLTPAALVEWRRHATGMEDVRGTDAERCEIKDDRGTTILWLAADRGYRPVRMVRAYRTEQGTFDGRSELDVLAFRQAEPGVWIPDVVVTKAYSPRNGKEHLHTVTWWRLDEIAVNMPMRDDCFGLDFPVGATVNTPGGAYVVGGEWTTTLRALRGGVWPDGVPTQELWPGPAGE